MTHKHAIEDCLGIDVSSIPGAEVVWNSLLDCSAPECNDHRDIAYIELPGDWVIHLDRYEDDAWIFTHGQRWVFGVEACYEVPDEPWGHEPTELHITTDHRDAAKTVERFAAKYANAPPPVPDSHEST